ncbi:neuronal acetylcholine receptor subunit alpha-3-like [Haliotis rubra]|uniref:neuronal acetylcholine receptor subunit alpha-3-like n=1 Tax=Haliotis rubra TaxID=36100 RepID=UPI001EE5542F|nr:neuronal acetylcholine receptor subunit alpha-3-like [Haliotis rubra]
MCPGVTGSTHVMMLIQMLLIMKVWWHCQCSVQFTSTSTNLRRDLLTDYDVEVRPALKTQVSLQMVLVSLNSIIWRDERLSWNPSDHNGTDFLALKKTEVWTPPLVVSNEMNKVGPIGQEGVPLRVFSEGTMLWIPPTRLETSCTIDVSNYPFDVQSCIINITGWTYATDELDLQIDPDKPITLDLYSHHGEWELTDTSASLNDFDGGFDKQYRDIQYSLTFRRRWQYYGLTLMLPLILSSFLMAGVFAVPVESGEKIGYSLTVLLSFTVLLTLISDSLPAISTRTSALQIYLTLLMNLGTLITFLTTLVLWLYYRGDTKPLSHGTLLLYRLMARCSSVKHKRRPRTVRAQVTVSDYNDMSRSTRSLNTPRIQTCCNDVSTAWSDKGGSPVQFQGGGVA